MTTIIRRLVAKAKTLTLLDVTLSLLTLLAVLQGIGLIFAHEQIRTLRAEVNAIYRANAQQYAEQHRDARRATIVPAPPKESY
jgi:hypothetical protein